jgi:AraC-like DNA-binding protein
MGMSRVQLHRKLSALFGHSASDLIRDFRLERAAELLRQKSGNVSEIAFQVGFENLSYFTKAFKQKYEITPSEYSGS